MLLAPSAARTQARVPPSDAEAISLLGDTLWLAPMPQSERQRRLGLLQAAREQFLLDSLDLDLRINLARRTSEYGRYREAIRLYDEAGRYAPFDPRVYLGRGEAYLMVRELQRAAQDFSEARLAFAWLGGIEQRPAWVSDAAILLEQLHASAFWLGVTRYLQGDFAAATDQLVGAVVDAPDADRVASSALWLMLAAERAGRATQASAIRSAVSVNLPVAERRAELVLIRHLRGELPVDSLRSLLRTAEEEALYQYVLGLRLLTRGRASEAERPFRHVLDLGAWTSLAYLAAEADLARLQRPGKG